MILIADGGSTKADWIALDDTKKEVFRTTTLGLNPSVLTKQQMLSTVNNVNTLLEVQNDTLQVHFYGAGCGSTEAAENLRNVLESVFKKATVFVSEDTLAAVYASTGNKPGIVCILGTGSNSCYYDGKNITTTAPSLGYTVMDEASGNYFGKQLLRDFYYKKMPKRIASAFKTSFDLDIDVVKMNLYREPYPNMYLASFAKFMLDHKDEKYVRKMIKKGIQEFFKYRILPFEKDSQTPIYFIGSIAYYFKDILEKIASKNKLPVTDVIQRPIDNLVDFHRNNSF
ncbi:N-acetylglucosamine kinase [Tenacibaculum sp. 1B UA]|uniref:N-acetylglucosamine kinase n=1 Tax=unclassified Tenacibaculum TaxID=2635139 RepID=UPI0026E19715|nr:MULTISPECIES: N-acetylglucosamine kinase [unclassified Tenacibaculum]MDO6676010.1 N-acetylglucosamine kinase [Tenacibaculum sp. 1_MG-2023]MDX8553615.1 N-acetylglucosamine kinase [Tenacibaculum sp. 1B UA]